jgi:hypothetical protein
MRDDGRVLLCRNRRTPWELPAADGCAFEMVPDTWVDRVADECTAWVSRESISPSDEHATVAFIGPRAFV